MGPYWRRHARQPIEFAKSVGTLADLGCAVLLEVGPQPVLTASALRHGLTRLPHHGRSRRCAAKALDHRQITEGLANAYIAGHVPHFGALQQEPARKVDVPTYPFQHRQYWFRDKQVKPTKTKNTKPPTRSGLRHRAPSGFSRTAGSTSSLRCSTASKVPPVINAPPMS